MRVEKVNIWDAHDAGHWVAITTNGDVRRDGCLVMGRGVARQAVEKYPAIQGLLGSKVRTHGNHVHYISSFKLFSFPVKHSGRDPQADLELVGRSARELCRMLTVLSDIPVVYLPKPGCGNGRLDWAAVRSVLREAIPGRRYIVCDYDGGTR